MHNTLFAECSVRRCATRGWVLASLAIMDRLQWISQEALKAFILDCQVCHDTYQSGTCCTAALLLSCSCSSSWA